MTKKDDKLSQELGLDPLVYQLPAKAEDFTNENEEIVKVIQNNKELITKGFDALDELIVIAKASEAPRAFEVVSNLIKTVSDVNKDVADIMQKKMDIETRKGAPEKSGDVTNILNVTTSELIDHLTKKAKIINADD